VRSERPAALALASDWLSQLLNVAVGDVISSDVAAEIAGCFRNGACSLRSRLATAFLRALWPQRGPIKRDLRCRVAQGEPCREGSLP
jgi:hypothetical protein